MRATRLPARLLVLGALLLAAPVALSETEDGAVPVENTSHVSDDVPWVVQAFERADEAVGKEDWTGAVRLLQSVVDAQRDASDEGAAAPYVVPVFGSAVYEGAWIVAHARILAAGEKALEAYAAEFGPVAQSLLDAGVARRDAARLAVVADRFLPLAQGRTAALLLADLALEVGDVDACLTWLQRLEDLEEAGGEPEARIAPWRRARIRRQAAALARPERREEVEALLAEEARPETPPARRYGPVPPAWRREEALPDGWTTTGGGPSRALRPPAAGRSFELAWWRPLEGGVEPPGPDEEVERARPSPWIPTRAVTADGVAFVCDGSRVEVWDLAVGRPLAPPYELKDAQDEVLSRVEQTDAREELGLLEGFSLTLGPENDGARILYVAAPDPERRDWGYGERREDRVEAQRRDDRIEALQWRPDRHRLRHLWTAGGVTSDVETLPAVRLYGAPLLYRGRLWVAGVRPARGAEHQADAWLFGLSPRTGEVEVRTYLGSGTPVRPGRPDEAIPSSPAGACGRVVVSTSLGIVAAVDARTGRVHWLYRNDRGLVGGGRLRRLQGEEDATPRETGFANGPPLIAFERVWVAPTDGTQICCLFDRPRGPERKLRSWRRDRRDDFVDFAAEQLVGLVPQAGDDPFPVLVVVGRGESSEGQPPAAIAKGIDALRPSWNRWEAFATTGDGPEPFGTALLTTGELFVPTRHGICVFALEDGSDLATIDVGSVPPRLETLRTPDVFLSGNVVPAPGLGLLVLGPTHAVLWRARPR